MKFENYLQHCRKVMRVVIKLGDLVLTWQKGVVLNVPVMDY